MDCECIHHWHEERAARGVAAISYKLQHVTVQQTFQKEPHQAKAEKAQTHHTTSLFYNLKVPQQI